MSRDLNPVAGRWYLNLDKDELFKVVSVDEDNDVIEVQHADGELEDLESADWFELDLERAAQPEDWLQEDDDTETDDVAEDADDDDDDDDWEDDEEEDDERGNWD